MDIKNTNEFSIVVAFDKNRGIGFRGGIPWGKNSADMKRFVSLTKITSDGSKNVVIMGRKTYESIGKPLPGRINIVLTRYSTWNNINTGDNETSIITCSSLNDALSTASNYKPENIFVIGGEIVYELALNNELCTKVYVTKFLSTYTVDRYFPLLPEDFVLIESSYETPELVFETYVRARGS